MLFFNLVLHYKILSRHFKYLDFVCFDFYLPLLNFIIGLSRDLYYYVSHSLQPNFRL